MTKSQTQSLVQWETLQRISFLLVLALLLGILGFSATFLLSAPLVAGLAGTNIFVMLGLFTAHLFKASSWLQWPLLILASFLAGLVTALIQSNSWLVLTSILILVTNFILLILFASYVQAEFQRFNLLIAILAIIFSFAGIMLIFVQGQAILTIIWTTAACICLDILLYTALKKALKTEVTEYFSMVSPILLLHIGFLVNVLIGLSAISLSR